MKAKTAKLVSRTALIKDLQHVLKVFPGSLPDHSTESHATALAEPHSGNSGFRVQSVARSSRACAARQPTFHVRSGHPSAASRFRLEDSAACDRSSWR